MALAWTTVGALLGGSLWVGSTRLLSSIGTPDVARHTFRRRWLLVMAVCCGMASGWRAGSSDDLAGIILLGVVLAAFVVQAPLDLLTRRLSRPITIVVAITVGLVVTIDVALEAPVRSLMAPALSSLAVVSASWVVHYFSPRSLGFGDVLLVAPLAAVLARFDVNLVAVWMLASSMTGALHGGLVLVLKRGRSIPFGPHLLLTAWLLTLYSV